jgi:hypothetical protein
MEFLPSRAQIDVVGHRADRQLPAGADLQVEAVQCVENAPLRLR